MDKYNQVLKKLKQNNQEHIIKLMENLTIEKKEELMDQVLKIDFSQIKELYESTKKEIKKENEKIEPIEYVDKSRLTEEEKIKLEKIGEGIIQKGQYAVVTMAGGQGTRLGYSGPKGTYKLEVGENGKYIFEILLDTLKRANKKYNQEINWYIMTGKENDKETKEFFQKNNHFGYNKEKIRFFHQENLPLMDKEGKILISKDLKIKEASNGNGGVYKALSKQVLEDMKEKGIKWIYICGVDNIMANMVDSLLLGLAIKRKVPTASKAIKKAYPEEKVGTFCRRNGKPSIIEYIEMTKEMIYAKNENAELLYGASNIIGHLFNIETLEKLAKKDLKYHLAVKKNSYINEKKEEIIPTEPNSYKFETFIFDGFEYVDDMIVMQVERDEEFAPIKNATGIDSPESAKTIYEKYWNKKK